MVDPGDFHGVVDMVYNLPDTRTPQTAEPVLHRIPCTDPDRVGRIGNEIRFHPFPLVEQGGIGRVGQETIGQESRIEIDPHVAIFVGQGFEHVVRQVAPVTTESPAAGMGRDDRSLGIPDTIPEGFIRCMGQVHHHAQGVHLGKRLLSERAESVPMGPLCRAVRQGIVPVMRQSDIPDTHPEESPQQRKGFLDGSPVLHSQENGHAVLTAVPGRIIRREGQGNQIRISFHTVIDGGKHFQGIPRRCIRHHFGRCIEGKKGAADSPAPEFGKIDVPVFIVKSRIPKPDQLGRGIDMAVKELHYFVP